MNGIAVKEYERIRMRKSCEDIESSDNVALWSEKCNCGEDDEITIIIIIYTKRWYHCS